MFDIVSDIRKYSVAPKTRKVNGPDIIMPLLTGKPEQQRFTMWSGVLVSISCRQHSAVIGRPKCPLPEWTDFGPHSLQL